MADTYKRVREQSHKREEMENEMDKMVNQLVKVKPQFSHIRNKSQMRPQKLQALSIDVTQNQK